MKITTTAEGQTTQSPVSSNMKVTRMGFDSSSHAFLMDALTNLYSNPELAVLREYPSNGIDSHIAAGVTRPVELTLPTPANPNFVVKDYGVGMSTEDIETIYSMYGASTKRNTNDQIGAFGLGAKSALTITPHFTFTSVKDGIKNIVLVMKGEDGVGDFKFLSTTETTEGNGVEVVIPIANVNKFNQEATKFFRSVDPDLILVNGERVTDTIYNTENWTRVGDAGWFHIRDFMNATTSRVYHPEGVRVKYGPVLYSLNNSTGNLYPQYDGFFKTNAGYVVLDIPIGDLDLTPSREDLRYSNRTVTRVKEALNSYLQAVTETMNELLQSYDSRIDAARFYAKATKAEIKLTPFWKGDEIPNLMTFDEGTVYLAHAQKGKRTQITQVTKTELGSLVGAFNMTERYVIGVQGNQQEFVFKNIKDYMLSHGATEMRVYAYNKAKVKDVWLTETSPSLEYQTILDDALDYRREQRRKAKARNTATPTSSGSNGGPRPSVSYFVLDTSSDTNTPVRVNVADIDKDALYLTDGDIGWANLVQAVRSGNGIYNFPRYYSHKVELIKALAKNRQIVLLPTNLSFDRFQKYLPEATKLVDYMAEMLRKWVEKLSPVAVAYATDHFNNNLGNVPQVAARLAEDDLLGDVVDSNLVERFKLALDVNFLNQLNVLTALRSYEFNRSPLKEVLVNGLKAGLQNNKYNLDFSEMFPLMGKNLSVSSIPTSHILGYINMVTELHNSKTKNV